MKMYENVVEVSLLLFLQAAPFRQAHVVANGLPLASPALMGRDGQVAAAEAYWVRQQQT